MDRCGVGFERGRGGFSIMNEVGKNLDDVIQKICIVVGNGWKSK